jgi:D-serine deaminase-like pyridoxal phosphate-dependent protein
MSGPAGGGLDLAAIEAQLIDAQFKAFPLTAEPVPIGAAGAQGWNALLPPFSTPVMVLKDAALTHNIDLMARYCADHQVSLAPHVKTPLSPQIAARQLAAGAWGLTVADVRQAAIMRSAGARRIVVANQVIDPASARWLADELNADPELELYCLVDSAAGGALLDSGLAAAGLSRPLPVLIELGADGGRCGCRSLPQAVALAQALRPLHQLRLVGVEAYEGTFPHTAGRQTADGIRQLLDDVRSLADQLDRAGLLDRAGEILISAGGSLWFDRVVGKLSGDWDLSRPARTVLRSGAYVTHDCGEYEQLSPLAGRSADPRRLRQALELWATVISRPEPGLAVLNFGKRDAALDRGFPVPFQARTHTGTHDLRTPDVTVLSLNDHHARIGVPASSTLAVGDLVGSHISHPCTSFQCWRLVPLVDEGYDVLGAVRTYL